MKNKHSELGFNITEDPYFTANLYGVDFTLTRKFDSIRRKVFNPGNQSVINELIHLIEINPSVPMLKNYLSVAYDIRGMEDKAFEMNNRIVAEHPDYFFGKLNKVNFYLNEGNYKMIPIILGEDLDIRSLYPDRDTFHISEIAGFFKLLVRYYSEMGEIEKAQEKLDLMKKIAPDHQSTEDAEKLYFAALLKNASNRLVKEREKLILPVIRKKIEKTGYKKAPIFNHPEIDWLYQEDIGIPREKLRKILELPRKTIVEDLETVLSDAVLRYGYFSESDDEKETAFLLHALLLLTELGSIESLPKILELFEYDDKFLEFWFGDHLTSTLWQVFYTLGRNQINLLKEFLIKPGIDGFAKGAVSEGLCQMVFHHPGMKTEIESVYFEVFTLFSSDDVEENLIDSEFLAMAVGDCIDVRMKSLLPIIKKLHDKDFVDLSVNGPFEKVEGYFRIPPKHSEKRAIKSIFDLYDDILKSWAGYAREREKEETPFFEQPKALKQAVSLKIGRNDPCPCGSGKKYKKCCGS